jgi:hypothetical protein
MPLVSLLQIKFIYAPSWLQTIIILTMNLVIFPPSPKYARGTLRPRCAPNWISGVVFGPPIVTTEDCQIMNEVRPIAKPLVPEIVASACQFSFALHHYVFDRSGVTGGPHPTLIGRLDNRHQIALLRRLSNGLLSSKRRRSRHPWDCWRSRQWEWSFESQLCYNQTPVSYFLSGQSLFLCSPNLTDSLPAFVCPQRPAGTFWRGGPWG